MAFRTGSGDILLHNSFMGALARLPGEAFEAAELALAEGGRSEVAELLARNGFHVPAAFDEEAAVGRLLEREGRAGFRDLILLPHEDCNFRCTYCYETHQRGRMAPWVVEGLKRFVAEGMDPRDGLNIRWFGGEPLLAMREFAEPFQVSLRVNFDPESLTAMEPFFEEVTRDFGEDPRFAVYFRPIGKYGGPNDAELSVCDPGLAKVLEMDLAREFSQVGRLDALVRKGLQAHGQVCYAAKPNSVVVGSDGALYKCSVAFEDPTNHVGRLRPDGTLEIDEARWERWVGTGHLDCSACGSCPVFPACQAKYCPRSSLQAGKPVCPMSPATYAQLVELLADGEARQNGEACPALHPQPMP